MDGIATNPVRKRGGDDNASDDVLTVVSGQHDSDRCTLCGKSVIRWDFLVQNIIQFKRLSCAFSLNEISTANINLFCFRIDFEDPATTMPPSMAKSAVLQALEEEERQQSRAKGKSPTSQLHSLLIE